MTGASHLLVLGIENYHEGALAKVTHAEKDAKEFAVSFLSLGYDKDDCFILLNDRATKTAIIRYSGESELDVL